jgi:hypothetical protein
MKLLQEKSQCCGAKILRFGGKRRQCLVCKKTWSVHPAKQGRKTLRPQPSHLEKVFKYGFSIKQISVHSKLTTDALYKRFGASLSKTVKKKRIVRIHGSKLILIIDAQRRHFRGVPWSMYFMAIKPNDSTSVTMLDPVLRVGRENSTVWRLLIDELHPSVKKRIIALVSDGIRGIETIAADNDWIIQRCHFHLLKILQGMRGKRLSTAGRLIREEIYCSVKLALSEASTRRLNILCRRLSDLSRHTHCPIRMRGAIRDFLRKQQEFRNYLNYPELNLPTTTNVMESNISLNKRKTRTVNTPNSWLKWATACVRFKSKFTCK